MYIRGSRMYTQHSKAVMRSQPWTGGGGGERGFVYPGLPGSGADRVALGLIMLCDGCTGSRKLGPLASSQMRPGC